MTVGISRGDVLQLHKHRDQQKVDDAKKQYRLSRVLILINS